MRLVALIVRTRHKLKSEAICKFFISPEVRFGFDLSVPVASGTVRTC